MEQLLKRMLNAKVEFVVVGGFAAVTHGVTLLTQDLDICCPFTETNMTKLLKALDGLHPVHRMTPARLKLDYTAQQCASLKNLYLDTKLGQLDCLSEITGIGRYEAVLSASEWLNLDYDSVPILGIDGLIKAKTAIDRPRDREAVLQLKAIRSRRP